MSEIADAKTAGLELLKMEEIFDCTYQGEDRDKLIAAIQSGRLMSDEENDGAVYTLLVPVELKNGEAMNDVKIKNPSFSDLEFINRGFAVKVDQGGDTVMDLSQMMSRTLRAVGRLTNIPAGMVERVKRKDMRIFGALLNFFD